MFNKYATTPLTGFGPDPRSFWDITPLLKTQAMWQQNIIDANKRYDNTIAEISKSTDPTNLLKNLNSSNLSSSARKQKDGLEDYKKKLEEQRKKAEKEEKDRLEKIRKENEDRHKRLLGDTKKSEQEIIKLENARVSAAKKVDREIETIEKRLEKTRGEVENINPNKVFALTNGESITTGVDKKEEERFKNKTAQIERDEKALEEKYKWREFVYSDDFTGKYIEDRNINYQNFLKKLGINNTSSPASNQEEMPDEIKEVINGTSQNGTTETKQKSTGKKLPQSENVYDLTTEEGKKRALEDRKKEPKKQQSKLSEYEETHRDLVEKSKADPNGVYIIDINNPSFLTGGKKQHHAGDRLASNRIEDLPNGTVVAYQGEVIRITGGDKIYGLETRKPKYDTPYEANTGNARSQKAQQDEIINSLPTITKQVEVDDKGYIIPDGDVRSGTGTITEVEDSLSNYADIGSAEWEEMGDMERKDKAQEFLNYYGKRLLEAQKENPEIFTNEKIKQLLAEKKAQFDENIRLYLEENSDNLAEDVGNVARDLAISTINFFDEGMAGIADVFGMNTVAEFFYRGAEDISEFKSKEQKRKDKNYQYLKAKYEKQFGNGLIDSAKAAILAADESDNLLNTLRDSLVPSLLFMGGTAGSLAKGSGFVAKNASKISTVGVMGISGAGSAGADVRTIKDLALRDENSFNNFLEAYKKKNGEKAYNALIESATKNGKLDKEELFNKLQSKAARIGGGLSATVGLISSSLGGDVETGLINRFVLGNAAARGAVGKLTALKLAGNIASSMANEGAEEAAETMSQNIALKYTADPERKITEGVGEATALGMAGGVIGGTLEYMGDRSARKEQQRLEQQQNQDQNQQTDNFEVEDNPPQLTEREQLEQLNDPNMPVEEETEQGQEQEQEDEQNKIEEQKKLEQKEEEKKEERLKKQYKRLFEPKGSFEEWLKDAEETIDTERQVKAMVDNLTDAQVREEIQWLFDNYIDNEEVLGHLSEDERKQFNEMLKTQFGLNTNPFVIVSEPTNAENFWTEPNNPIDVSPDIANAMAVSEGMGFNFNADDEAYFQHMANVLNNTLVNNEEWNKATNTNERRAVLQKALDAELKDAQDIDEDKKNEMRLILSMELLANGVREFDKQTKQEEVKPVEIEDHLGNKEEKSNGKKQETPKQEKSDGVKQTDGEFTAEDVANHSSEALTAYRQSGLPKAGKAIKDNTIAKYLNMSDEEASAKLNKQYGKKRGAERKALLDQIKEEIRSKKNGQQTNATENTGQSEETSGERTGEEEQRGAELGNDEQGTTGDASAESVGDTSQGQGSTESNQTDTSTETANSTGGTTDQTGQGENTLNEGTSSEVENDNRQVESEGDTDKKSKGRKSTKSTNAQSKKNATGGRKPRIEETERNTNDRGGETVAEEGVETTPTADKTARQQLNDLGFDDNEITNLTADLTGTLNEEEVKKAARKKGIRAKKKLDEVVELFEQDIIDRLDDGEIKFSIRPNDNSNNNSKYTKEVEEKIRNELKKHLPDDQEKLVNIISYEDAVNEFGDSWFDDLDNSSIYGAYYNGKVYLIGDSFVGKEELAPFVAFHELAHYAIDDGGYAQTEPLVEWHSLLKELEKNANFRKLLIAVGNSYYKTQELWFSQRAMREEVIAELYGAYKTGNWAELENKYNIKLSDSFKKPRGELWKFFEKVKDFLGKFFNKKRVSDDMVFAVLGKIDTVLRGNEQIPIGSDFDRQNELREKAAKEFTKTEKALGGYNSYKKARDNGKTELNYNQWVQVRTPSFKRWFGDWENDPENASKIVNPRTGEPLVIYKGVKTEYTTNVMGGAINFDYGAFFAADSIERANDYITKLGKDVSPYHIFTSNDYNTDTREGMGGIFAYFANIRNPRIIDYNGEYWADYKKPYVIVNKVKSISRRNIRTNNKKHSYLDNKLVVDEFFATEQEAQDYINKHKLKDVEISSYAGTTDEQVSIIKDSPYLDYDGIIHKDIVDGGDIYDENGNSKGNLIADNIVAFYPNQLKSANFNVGSFLPESGNIKFSLTSPDHYTNDELPPSLYFTTPSEVRQEVIDIFGEETSNLINIFTLEDAKLRYGDDMVDGVRGMYDPNTGEITVIIREFETTSTILGTVFHELAHAVINVRNKENMDASRRESDAAADALLKRKDMQTYFEKTYLSQMYYINSWFNKLEALNKNKWIKLLADYKKKQYKEEIEERKKSDFYNTEYGRLKANTTHIEEAFVEFYRAYKTNNWGLIEEQIGEEIPRQFKERNEAKNPIIKLFNEFKDLLANIFQKFYEGKIEGNQDVEITDDMVLAALGEVDTDLFGEGRQDFLYQMTTKQLQALMDEEFDDDGDTKFSIRTDPPPKKTQIGYKAFDIDIDRKTGKVLGVKPAKVADGNTPLGVWLDADAAEYFYAPKRPTSKADYNRMIAENGGKPFTDGKRYIWGSDGKALAYRPGWHFTNSIDASQFNKKDKETGRKGALFPNNKVWAEIEYAADRNYYENADAETKSKIESKAGLDYIPENGYYPFTTNQKLRAEGNEEWGISGAIKINRFLTRGEEQQIRAEQAENMSNPERKAILSKPIEYQAGDLITDDVVNELNRQIQETQNENDATRRNDEQQGDLGGNQSAETRAENDNQGNSTQSNDTTPNEPTRNGNGKTRQRKAQKQKIIKSITGFNGEINDNQSSADPAELKASIENELRNTFGEETAGQVQVMTLEELRKTQPKTADSVEKYNVRGFYKPKSGQVVVIADHFAGLSPKEASLVAFHELGHKTMGAKRAEWDKELARLSNNKTISKIKNKLKQIEGYKNLNDVELTEEVMADLFAAHQSGDWNSFADKYGVEFSKDLTGETRTLYERFKDFIKNFFGYGENEQVSDREVRAALGKLSLEFNGETEADLNSQEKSIADVNSYIEQVRNGQAQDERISALVEQGLSDEDIVKDLFGELADADAEGKTYKSNLPENISNAIQNAWNGIKNTVSTVALGTATWVGTNLGMSQEAMAQDFNYSNPAEFESQVVRKIVDTNDHLGETFAVVNKQNGSLTIYDRNGNQIATTPALYGKKVGDTFNSTSSGTTPSGKFGLSYANDPATKAYGGSVIDLTQNGKYIQNKAGRYSIHRTYTAFPNERREARINSPTPADNKISLGCINVPPEFYDAHFENNQFGNMPLYVLPETPTGRTGIFSNQPTQKKESISGDPETDEILRKYNVKNKGNPAKNKPYTNDYMENVNPFATAQAVSNGEVKNAELEGLTSTYKELNQINIGDSIAQDPTDRQDVLTTGFKDGLSSASMVTYNYGSEPDFNEEVEDDPRLTPSERLANGDFDSMPIQRGVREDSTEDDDIYKASIGIVGGLEIALATKGVVNAVKTTQKRKSTGAKKLLPSQAPNQQYVDNRRKAWQNHIRKVSNDIDPETIDKKTGIGKNWTQARLDELADLYFNIDDFSDSLFDASSYKQSRTSDFDNHRTWGNNRLLRWVFKTFGGATPAFDNALGRQNIKRFGYEADSAIPSVHFARIKALTNGAMGHLQRSYLRPLHRQTEYLAQDLGKSTKQIRQDAGELATIDHILDEGADHFFRGLDLAIQEAKGKYANLQQALIAAANTGNIRQYDKIDAQMKQLNEEIRKARIERVRSYRVYKGRDPDNGQTLLPGGFTEQMLNDKRTELQNKYGNDFSRLKKHSDEIVDITQKVRNFGATNGVFCADSLNTIQKLGFTNYVPLYTNPTENENLELDFDKSPFELLNELTQRTTNDILNLGVSSNVLKNILGNGTTRDFTSFGRSGSTSEKQALNAYENLETFAQKIAARTGTIPFAQSVQQLFEGTVGESMQTVNKRLNFAEFNSKPRLDANGNPMFDKNGKPLMENMTMRGGNSKFKGLIRFPSDMSNDWKQPLTREEIRQLEQDLGMQPGKLGTPSQLKSRLASLQPIRGKGYNSDGELKNYDYYFIEPDVSNEINQSFNHLAKTRLGNDGGRLFTDILGAGTKLESKLMTSYNLVWNGVNFMRDSLERWSIMLNRPVKDSNGNLVSKWDLTKTYENNLAKLIGSPTEAMPEIYRYLTENEVKTELQRQLQEAVRGGGIQLMNDLLRKDSSILLDNKNEVIEKVLKHMEHWTNTGVNKIGGGGIRNTLKEVNASYIAAFVEIPQVISALAAYQTYQQLGVNKQESLNRTRDMFDPLRTRNNLVSSASKWYPFVRATLSGHYNLIRTLTQYWKPGEKGWMTGYLLGGTATAYAFYALAAGFMGDDDDGIPKIAKMSIQQLMQGIPIPAYKKGFFSIPTGFGINKVFSSLAAILFKYNNGQLSRGDAFKASLDLIFENTTPMKPVHSRDNSILGSMILTFIPYMFKTAAESYAGQRSNGSTLYKVQKKLGQKKHQIDDFTVPDKYKSLAKTLHDWSGGLLDFNPETLELFADNVFQGPLKVIPQNFMQDRAEKTLGHETSKGEFIGLVLNLIGAGILSSPTAFEDYNFIHAFQRQRVGILETFGITETGQTMMDENGTLITDAKAMGLDATQNVARRLAEKGASREVINFVVNNRNFTKIRNDLQRDLRHYLNIHNRHKDPKVRAMAREQAEDLWNRIEGLQKFYIKNEGRSWYEMLQYFNEGGLSREVLQSPY